MTMLHERDCVTHTDAAEAYRVGHSLFSAKRYREAGEMFAAGFGAARDDSMRSRLLLGCAMTQYYLGEFTPLEQTIAQMATIPMTPDVRSRWLMLRGRVLGHYRSVEAFSLYAEAEAAFRELGILQDEAWAQLSAARLALIMGLHQEALDAVLRVTFAPYLPKARLLEAEIRLGMGDTEAACGLLDSLSGGTYGPSDDVDHARALYVKSAVQFKRGDFVEAAFLLGEARSKALSAPQRDYELLNCIERLHNQLMIEEEAM